MEGELQAKCILSQQNWHHSIRIELLQKGVIHMTQQMNAVFFAPNPQAGNQHVTLPSFVPSPRPSLATGHIPYFTTHINNLVHRRPTFKPLLSCTMGSYSTTYLCFGKFTNKNTADAVDKIRVGSMDQMIERKEWQAGFVNINEIEASLSSWKIKLEEDNEVDLYMEEVEPCTLEYPPSSTSKYILVNRGVKFVKLAEE